MKYQYKAIQNNSVVKGEVNAESDEKVVQYLKSQDLMVISVKRKGTDLGDSSANLFSRASFNDIVNFTRQLSIMLNSGLTVIESLDILKRQTDKKGFLNVLKQIDEDVRGGQSFSQALSSNKHFHFSNLYIALVKAGEASGKLDEILLKLADNLEKQRTLRGRLKGALIYPVIVVVGMIIVMFIMMTFVLPELLNLYKDFNVDLPLPTQILIAISTFLQKTWILLIVATTGAFLLLRRSLRTRKGKKTFDALILHIPVVKKIVQMSTLVDATRTLSILIGSGVSILEGLDIIIETSTNIIYEEAFVDVYKKIERGETLGKALAEATIFPVMLVQMASVGEETGHLDETLLRISHFFEMESDLAIKAMTTLIEPAILVFLGLGVGGLVLAVITPIYNLTNTF